MEEKDILIAVLKQQRNDLFDSLATAIVKINQIELEKNKLQEEVNNLKKGD